MDRSNLLINIHSVVLFKHVTYYWQIANTLKTTILQSKPKKAYCRLLVNKVLSRYFKIKWNFLLHFTMGKKANHFFILHFSIPDCKHIIFPATSKHDIHKKRHIPLLDCHKVLWSRILLCGPSSWTLDTTDLKLPATKWTNDKFHSK